MKRLTQSQVAQLHHELIERFGGSHGLQDEGLLDSALNAPFQTFSGAELYPDTLEKAAQLTYSLIKNHPSTFFLNHSNIFGDSCSPTRPPQRPLPKNTTLLSRCLKQIEFASLQRA